MKEVRWLVFSEVCPCLAGSLHFLPPGGTGLSWAGARCFPGASQWSVSFRSGSVWLQTCLSKLIVAALPRIASGPDW